MSSTESGVVPFFWNSLSSRTHHQRKMLHPMLHEQRAVVSGYEYGPEEDPLSPLL